MTTNNLGLTEQRPAKWQPSPETLLTALLFLFSFFATGLPRVFTSTATHTILIDRYGAAAVPVAYVLEALLVPLAGYFFVRFESRLPLRRLVIGTLWTDLAVLVCLWISYQVPALSWVAFAGIVWFEVEFALVSLMLWGMANQYMTLSQGKRLFGIVGSGEPTAVIVGGVVTIPLLHWLRPEDLLLMSGLGVLVGVGLASVLTRRFKAQRDDDGESTAEEHGKGAPMWRNGYVRVLMTALFFSQLCYFFIDSAFYERAHHRFPDEHELATFIATTSAVVGCVSLCSGLFISGPLVTRYGLRSGLLALPSLLLIGVIAILLFGHLTEQLNWVFWLVVGNKVVDQALRYTLDKTSSVMLLQPIPADKRNGIQAAMESIVEPLAGGAAGVLLLVMTRVFGWGAFGITHAILVALSVWVALVFVEHKGYLAALKEALGRRNLDVAADQVVDGEGLEILHQGLGSEHLGEVIYCLTALSSRGVLTKDQIAQLLGHPHPEVRKAALAHVESSADPGYAQLVSSLLRAEYDDAVITQAIGALAATQPLDAVDAIKPYMDSANPRHRLASFSALIRHCGIEGILNAGEPLLKLLNSETTEGKILAAKLIAATASPHLRRPLIRLLGDSEVSVRKAALHGAAAIADPTLWPYVVPSLATPGCEAAAVSALARGGEPALLYLDAYLEEPSLTNVARRHGVDALAAINGAGASSRLQSMIGYPERTIHRTVLRQIANRKEHCDETSMPRHTAVLEGELATLAWLMQCRDDLREESRPHPALTLLRSSLATEIEERIEDLLRLVAFLTPDGSLDHAVQILRFGNESERAYLAEAVDSHCDRKLKPLLAALLAETAHEGYGRFKAQADTRPSSVETRLAELSESPAARVTPWLRACAIYCLRALDIPLPEGLLRLPAADRVHPVSETLDWATRPALGPLEAAPC